jgi:hypothetical protein
MSTLVMQPDRMLGSYRLVERIGAGGMGEVWKAEDTRLGRHVAIKILPPAVAADQEAIARMRREARTAASINHPNVATIHSFEETGEQLFIVMELVAGDPLTTLIARGPLAEAEVCRIGRGIADALAEAHEKGVVHRDIKPDNVIVSGIRVKVLDFGIAKQLGVQQVNANDPTTPLTQQGMIIGTVTYMSPEQALGRPLDHRTDLFSLGVVLYQAATGSLPFRGESVTETITQIVRDEPPPPRTVNPNVSPGMASIISRCLRKHPNDRWAGAAQLATALEQQMLNAPTAPQTRANSGPAYAQTIRTGSQLQTVQRTAPRGRGWVWAGVAAGVVVALVALAIGYALMVRNERTATITATTATVASQPPSTATMEVVAVPVPAPSPGPSLRSGPPSPTVAGEGARSDGDTRGELPLPPAAGEGTRSGAEGAPSPDSLYAEGLALLRRRRELEAIQRFLKATELDPTFARAHMRLGILALFAHDAEDARARLAKAREHRDRLTPRESRILDFASAINAGDQETARTIGRELFETYPNDPELRRFREELGERERGGGPRPQRRGPFRPPRG